MCLSNVYEMRGDERHLLAKNVADIREDNGELILTDIMGIRTKMNADIETVDLMENFIIVKPYEFEGSSHGHHHSPEEKKKQINRLSKAIGHCKHVKQMLDNDADCSEVLVQLSAVNAALRNLGKEIINEHMTHCITHAIEDGDTTAVEEFQEAVKKFI